MTLTVRECRADDAAAAAEVLHRTFPFMVTTPEVVAWQLTRSPAEQRFRLLIAERDGRALGTARTGLFADSSTPGQAFVNIGVHPEHRGQGAGRALLAAAEEYVAGIGGTAALAWVLDDGHSPAFAERHGYRRGGRSRFQRLDLTAALPPVPPTPDGCTLCTAEAFADDPRPLYECDAEATLDEPGEVVADAMTYDYWLASVWRRPDLDLSLTSAAVVDGRVAAFSAAHTDGADRYWSAMTGTRRAYRGRGLAKLVKTDSLHRARAAGYTEAYTGNDAQNGPMLAINAWLGYRPAAAEWRYRREL